MKDERAVNALTAV